MKHKAQRSVRLPQRVALFGAISAFLCSAVGGAGPDRASQLLARAKDAESALANRPTLSVESTADYRLEYENSSLPVREMSISSLYQRNQGRRRTERRVYNSGDANGKGSLAVSEGFLALGPNDIERRYCQDLRDASKNEAVSMLVVNRGESAEKNVELSDPASQLDGLLAVDQKSVFDIMRDAPLRAIVSEGDPVDGHACAVVEAKGPYGTHRVWLDPEAGYLPRKITVAKGEADLAWGDPLSKFAPGPRTPSDHPANRPKTRYELTMENIQIERIEGIPVVVSADLSEDTYYKRNQVVRHDTHKIRRVVDFHHPFKEGEPGLPSIADGVMVEDKQHPGIQFRWHDGQPMVVPPPAIYTMLGAVTHNLFVRQPTRNSGALPDAKGGNRHAATKDQVRQVIQNYRKQIRDIAFSTEYTVPIAKTSRIFKWHNEAQANGVLFSRLKVSGSLRFLELTARDKSRNDDILDHSFMSCDGLAEWKYYPDQLRAFAGTLTGAADHFHLVYRALLMWPTEINLKHSDAVDLDILQILDRPHCEALPDKEATFGPETVVVVYPDSGQPDRRIWLDMRHGGIAMRSVIYNPDGSFGSVETVDALHDVGGIPFPAEGTFSFYEDGAVNYQWRIRVPRESLRINGGLTEKDFALNLPPGTVVLDSIIRNTQYVIGKEGCTGSSEPSPNTPAPPH